MARLFGFDIPPFAGPVKRRSRILNRAPLTARRRKGTSSTHGRRFASFKRPTETRQDGDAGESGTPDPIAGCTAGV